MMKNFNNSIIFMVSVIFLLFLASPAKALMIEIENISNFQQSGISMGFSLSGSSTRDLSKFFSYDLAMGGIYTTPDIPEISGTGVSLFSYSLYPSNISYKPFGTPISSGQSFEIGSNVGLDRVRLTFSNAAIPEPASLILLGSGLLGLIALRKK